MAGFASVRLIDRSLASVQSLLIDQQSESFDDRKVGLDALQDQTILFLGVTGQASEVAVIRCEDARLHQLSTAGHWHTGSLPWLQRLVDLAASRFIEERNFDPRKKSKLASRLQVACERAMNSLFLLPRVKIKFTASGKERAVYVERQQWLMACEDLIAGVRKAIKTACDEASTSIDEVDVCVTLGSLLGNATIRDSVLTGQSEKLVIHKLDRADAACGAAACLAAELPGRKGIARPPRHVTSQSIGLIVTDAKGRGRILPIIPKGTFLPARTNRRLSVPPELNSLSLSVVESAGVDGERWHKLGNHELEIGDSEMRVRMISFQVDINGLLSIRAQTPGTSGSTQLAPLPTPMLSDDEIETWSQWRDTLG